MSSMPNSLASRCIAELLGTFILVLIGCGAGHAAVLANAHSGLWQVSNIWGIAVMLAVYVVGAVSGAHLNPAISLSLAAWGRFPKSNVVPYIIAQLTGGFMAAAVLFVLYQPFLAQKEAIKMVHRGDPGSEITAMCYGCFYPSPGSLANGNTPFQLEEQVALSALVSEPVAFAAEVLVTAILALVIFAVTDDRNSAAPLARLAPVFIGLTVAVLVSIIGPLTQSSLNPARDSGPRFFAYLAGWGKHAFPPGTGYFTVYLLAPVVGAVLGGGLYLGVLRPSMIPAANDPTD
jgi:glycerol uptake facilitator protein